MPGPQFPRETCIRSETDATDGDIRDPLGLLRASERSERPLHPPY
jgi:hypothetical protein